MPWFPIKGVVKRLRLQRHWDRLELAKKSGVKIRTIRQWESDEIPRTAQAETVKCFSAAFGVEREVLATWRDYDPAVDDDLGDASADAPAKSTLGIRAARDDIREWITPAGGPKVELVRPRLLHRLHTAPGLYDGSHYALCGKVREHRSMPPVVGNVLKLESPVCGQFLVVRRVHTGDICYMSPFSATREQTARLLDVTEAKEPVTLLVRIAIKLPEDGFKGFAHIQKRGEKQQLHKWCFVVDEVLEGEPAVTYGDSAPMVDDIAIEPALKKAPSSGKRTASDR